MDDIGNLIYLIVLALSFVIGIWQKANKRKQQEQPSAPVDERTDEPFYDQDPSPEMVIPSYEEERLVAEQELQAAELLKQMQAKALEAKKGRRLKSIYKKKPLMGVDETNDAYQDDLDLSNFDAKKAVIYSEILNPPYL